MKQNKRATIHYHRPTADYAGWGLHLWGDFVQQTSWDGPLYPNYKDDFGLCWQLEMDERVGRLYFLLHRDEEKDSLHDQTITIPDSGCEIWLVQGLHHHYPTLSAAQEAVLILQTGDITNNAEAHWLARNVIAWPLAAPRGTTFILHTAADAQLTQTPAGIQGGKQFELVYESATLAPELVRRFPHLANCVQLGLDQSDLDVLRQALKGQLAVSASHPDLSYFRATALQTQGILDDLYLYRGPLGVSFEDGMLAIRLWAPTARSVRLHLFRREADQVGPTPIVQPMTWDPTTGVWEIPGEGAWRGSEYLFEVEVYMRKAGQFIRSVVTDPYSISLTKNSQRSQIIDIGDQNLKPSGWDDLGKPRLEHPADISLYELHIRDFSASDESVPESHRGGFLAFTDRDSSGMRHLKRLVEAGITHIHLLPAFDFGSVDEDKSHWLSPDLDRMQQAPADSQVQQEAISRIIDRDGYNWGYDPLHWMVPEGSYSSSPDGPERILEFRRMVLALNQAGLRVVMDMVFNHVYTPGSGSLSNLEKIVPGYYHRLDPCGEIMLSTCCPDTATENAMMEKLMIDSLVHWATVYKVDGFRFDLMGHHLAGNMEAALRALRGLDTESAGVDGAQIFLYGEGWDFGGLAHNARGENASQVNIAGRGIATFNDRIRDAIRGGGAFQGYREVGFAFGTAVGVAKQAQKSLLELSLAGNLAEFSGRDAVGRTVPGSQIAYHGGSAGYTREPWESIQYISAHDNETWFDAVQIKSESGETLEERLRVHRLGLSLLCLTQGIPFFHAGDEILRSKSLDRNSYNSGDWFNRLDYSYRSNNWGVGLPLREENASHWLIQTELLSRPELRPTPEQIRLTLEHFVEMLRIRRSTPLLRLRTAEAVLRQVSFLDQSSSGDENLIAMRIVDDPSHRSDPNYREILILANAARDSRDWGITGLPGPYPDYRLHPVLINSSEPLIRHARYLRQEGRFIIPGRIVLVYVDPHRDESQAD